MRPWRRQGPAPAAPTIDTMRPREKHPAIPQNIQQPNHISLHLLRPPPPTAPMRPTERPAAILEIVDEHRHVSVDFLAQRFGASRETIRRDLTRLARDGRLRKYHG